jgi:hypothetical protein
LISVLAFILGVALASALVAFARSYPPTSERCIYAVGLVLTALVYFVLAVWGRASGQWLALESLGVILYGAAALGGLRGRPWLLAMGWAAHVAWDVFLHLSGTGSEYTPNWYPWLCVSFDLVVAGAALASSRRAPANLRNPAYERE